MNMGDIQKIKNDIASLDQKSSKKKTLIDVSINYLKKYKEGFRQPLQQGVEDESPTHVEAKSPPQLDKADHDQIINDALLTFLRDHNIDVEGQEEAEEEVRKIKITLQNLVKVKGVAELWQKLNEFVAKLNEEAAASAKLYAQIKHTDGQVKDALLQTLKKASVPKPHTQPSKAARELTFNGRTYRHAF